jgi:signal transduction histidine kinase/ActR/RegA family two-component response regulator
VQDITERKRAAAEMQALNERYARHEAAMATLTRSHVQSPSQFPEVLRAITEVVGRTLEVARVAVWRPNADMTTFVLHDLYEWPNDNHSSGRAISGQEVSDYARTLAAADIVAAADALRDERTAPFTAAHLAEFGVTAVIDVPIREQGAMAGVLCCGHVGPRRKWTPDEQTFAVAVANLLSSLFAQVARQHLEEQLRQAQKLEGIGQLAGGVAHDFNNVLTVILGKAGQLSDDPRLAPDLREATHDIIQSGERAANLTRQLLAFSRRQAMQVRDVDLNVVIRGVSRMLERVLGEDLTLRFSYATEPALVSADPGMIDQMVLNLAINARDAMPRGGLLAVETALVDIDDQAAGRVGQEAGSYACVRVTDTGCGIPPENLPHIFEPFFTTMDIGKGTGLGLATTYGIVQQHGGWIDVESEVGRGTTFRVFLPRLAAVRPALPAATVPAPAAVRPATGRETILVVEDEAEVRSLIVEALAGFGYQMLEAESGPLALDVWRAHGAPIDLLVTDMVMPDGMNGLELASELTGLNPGLRIIYISGYLADVSQEELLRSEGATYLAKPFSLPALARVVRTALDATNDRRQMRR